jgi:hypothetical protein
MPLYIHCNRKFPCSKAEQMLLGQIYKSGRKRHTRNRWLGGRPLHTLSTYFTSNWRAFYTCPTKGCQQKPDALRTLYRMVTIQSIAAATRVPRTYNSSTKCTNPLLRVATNELPNATALHHVEYGRRYLYAKPSGKKMIVTLVRSNIR